jgi:hypothetical protein
MQLGSRSRTIALGGICLMALLADRAPVHAQAMQGSNATASNASPASSNASSFNPYDPQWALAAPFAFNMGSGVDRQVSTMKLGSGTLGLVAITNNQDYGARAIGSSGNFFDPLPFSSMVQPSPWFSSLNNTAWRSSFVGSYKSNPNDSAINGLYTTASFGVTNLQTGPASLPGLTNFTSGNNATAMTATAGVGYQITPQITIEGSVGFTQIQASPLR